MNQAAPVVAALIVGFGIGFIAGGRPLTQAPLEPPASVLDFEPKPFPSLIKAETPTGIESERERELLEVIDIMRKENDKLQEGFKLLRQKQRDLENLPPREPPKV